MKKLYIPLFLFSVLFFVGAGCAATNGESASRGSAEGEPAAAPFVFADPTFDFGVVKQSGGKVSHDFVFTYNGAAPVVITGVPTSCACTSATVDTTRLNLGDTGTLTVTFNPNLHEEPEGRFFKTATLLTEPAMEDIPQATIWVDIDLDLGADAYELKSEHEEEESSSSYQSITPEKLGGLLEDENVWLIDVHIPEQEHIPGTDAFIPYHRIEGDPALPKDKNTPIVLYCRSGGMSRAAAEALVQDGYTNVYDLAGGKNAYDAFLDASEKSVDMRANEQVGFIQFEARTVTRQNMPELLAEFGDELNDLALDLDKTNVFLLLNNHRIDLAEFDYQNISTLDGDGAESWKPFSDAIGGHHVAGVLVFDRVAKPERLAITGLPVGEVNLVLNQM